MNHDHLSDEALSALIDQLHSGHSSNGQAHLAGCASCEQRLRDLRVVVEMLRALPAIEPPRSFVLGPRPAAEPANVVRLRRWYVATRALGASLAAVFVLLVAGSAYLDLPAGPAQQPTSEPAPLGQPALAPAPDAAPRAAAPTPPATPVPAGAAAPRVQVQRPAAPAAPAPGDATPSTDQVIATTAVRPLPTLTPVRLPPPVAAVVREAPAGDPGAPLRVAASVVGVLAVLSLLLTVVLRHRLRQA